MKNAKLKMKNVVVALLCDLKMGRLVALASGTLGESGERKVDSGKVERWKS